MRVFVITIFITAALLILFTHDIFLREPSVWPDEALIADTARSLLHRGHSGTPAWNGLYPGIDQRALFYPPVTYYLTAAWFQFADETIFSQRLLSQLLGLAVIFLAYQVSFLIIKQTTSLPSHQAAWFAAAGSTALLLDATFLRGSRVGRPEIFLLFFGLLSVYLYLQSTLQLSSSRQTWLLSASGLAASFAFLSHFNGGLFGLSLILSLIWRQRRDWWHRRTVYLFILAAAAPVLLWLAIIVHPHWTDFFGQVMPNLALKRISEPWMITLSRSWQPITLQLAYALYGLVTLLFLGLAIKKRTNAHILLSLLLLLAWVIIFGGRLFWYAIFPVTITYIALSVLLAEAYHYAKFSPKQEQPASAFLLATGLLVLLVGANLNLHYRILNLVGRGHGTYEAYASKIADSIPPNAAVFLSAIPDPYYGLIAAGRQNTIYEFPAAPTSEAAYLNLLHRSNYIVYNGQYEVPIFGNLLPLYIEQNSIAAIKIGSAGEYQAYIFQLKPQSERQSQP
jgi:4-amino-4-deoxy-L-arabinose transferase-like glycosyltransferase